MITENTQREIFGTIQLLREQGILKGVSKHEAEIIYDRLLLIAKSAVNDYRAKINDVSYDAINELKNFKPRTHETEHN